MRRTKPLGPPLPPVLTIDQALEVGRGLVSRTRLFEAIKVRDEGVELASRKPAKRRLIRTHDFAEWLGMSVAELEGLVRARATEEHAA